MLLIQHIHLNWEKECRGAPYSTYRNQMQKAYMLPKHFMETKSGVYLNLKQKKLGRENNLVPYPIHFIYLSQNKEGICEGTNSVLMHSDVKTIRIGALEGIQKENNYEIIYKYDYHRAIPERQYFDYKLNSYRLIDETAMTLAPGDYGRIIYNGRFISWDRDSYYELHIVNLINLIHNDVVADIFCSRQPDHQYSQIAHLY